MLPQRISASPSKYHQSVYRIMKAVLQRLSIVPTRKVSGGKDFSPGMQHSWSLVPSFLVCRSIEGLL